jgi:UDP:flavonoid glycosyltransferase YjiC (YdhE family)
MARILLSTFGSFGDLYPYIALGSELRRRGHAVTIATSGLYRAQVETEGLMFHAVRPDISLDNRDLIAYVMDARRGSERLLRYLALCVRESYQDVLAAAQDSDIIGTHPATYAAVLVAQKLRMPWFSTVLAPLSLFSMCDPPVVAPAPWLVYLRFLGPRFLRLLLAPGMRQTLRWMRPLLELRRELGLGATANPIFDGQHSPSLVLALFSQHLADPQPDWPPQTVVTGFPFYEHGELASDLEEFLDAGPAPVVFTLGSSAVGAAGDFYLSSLAAVRRLGVRAVFLTGAHPQGLPEVLPEGALEVAYSPHSLVFPRASAIVHQGGIGTTAQALRSGHPMLVVPFAHDQFDNGERVRRLSVAKVLCRSRYNARRAEVLLRRLLEDAPYGQAASAIGEKVRAENGCAIAADAIETLL